MVQVQYTGGKNPQENPQGFIAHVKNRFPGISTEDIQAMYTRAVMLYRPPTSKESVALFGEDILSADVESAPWWTYIHTRYRKLILSHPVDTGLEVEGVGQANAAIRSREVSRSGLNRKSLISLPGLQNTYVWCKMTSWIQDVDPHDLDIIFRHKGARSRDFVRRIRVIDDHGPYAYVRPYGEFHVKERFPVRTEDDFAALKRDQSRTEFFHGFDAIKE